MSEVNRNYVEYRLMTFGIAVFVVLATVSCVRGGGPDTGTWPDTAQWSTLESGQDRWSRHETSLDDVWVLVDHETGVAYLETESGLCRMTDADSVPMTDAEGEGE